MARRNTRNTYTKRGQTFSSSSSLAGIWLLLGILLGVGIMGLAYIFYNPANLKHFTQENKGAGRVSNREEMASKESNFIPPHKKRERGANVNNNNTSAQRFEFYTMLPGMEVELPASIPSKTITPTPTPKPIPTDTIPSPQPKTASKDSKGSLVSEPAPSETPPKSVQNKTLALTPSTTLSTHSTTLSTQTPAQKLKPSSQYIVQAGIFQALTEADTLKARLTLQGFAPQIQKVQTQDGHAWFRVTLGPFASESLALNQKKRLENQKVRGILILQRANEGKI